MEWIHAGNITEVQQHGALLVENLTKLIIPIEDPPKTGTRTARPPMYAAEQLGLSIEAVKSAERLVWDAIDLAVAGDQRAAEDALDRAIANLKGAE